MSEPNSPDLASWRKSSFSLSGECIEAVSSRGTVFVRDSTDRDGPQLEFADGAWRNFLAGLVIQGDGWKVLVPTGG